MNDFDFLSYLDLEPLCVPEPALKYIPPPTAFTDLKGLKRFRSSRIIDFKPTNFSTTSQHQPTHDDLLITESIVECLTDEETCGYRSSDSSTSSQTTTKRRRTNKPHDEIFQDPQLFKGQKQTGTWKEHEDKLLLHIMYAFISVELRTIAAVAWKCGIRRPRRAIDKKIKRTLRFGKWRDREVRAVRSHIQEIMVERKMQSLDENEEKLFEEIREHFKQLGVPSERYALSN
mmetsp:Transcript_17203/g.29479  ORF Transcript_17203/g.29479 Transcript_17203/m.29479 type:complete len:231 (+) Transcript_17203:1192-1884(+)|eukprot:CAMPEP_0203761384 /NCGR_PEP_ID=MMETSP0098-20131031/14485_1 /ASSEMBLY_ACC=CAM_ASM_000208 /TAXON_ID=96639 /ORGANISM=" , Strain NY0313808BC1" /LENGTH=230 /DNA_ID=CAMNT_0050655363 /DNA_START=1037 /DNA_END=1729 /DNA_ORIENTATION=+